MKFIFGLQSQVLAVVEMLVFRLFRVRLRGAARRVEERKENNVVKRHFWSDLRRLTHSGTRREPQRRSMNRLNDVADPTNTMINKFTIDQIEFECARAIRRTVRRRLCSGSKKSLNQTSGRREATAEERDGIGTHVRREVDEDKTCNYEALRVRQSVFGDKETRVRMMCRDCDSDCSGSIM